MNRYDRMTALVTAAIAALVLIACLALQVNPAHAAKRPAPFVSEQRMELILGATDTPVGTFDPVLCMGIGERRGRKLPRFRKFVCSGIIYPDTLVIIRARLDWTGQVVFG